MFGHFPKALRTRWFKKSTDVLSAQLFGMDPGPHNGVRPGGVGKAQSENTSSIVLILSRLRQRQAVPLKSLATESMS